MTTDSAHTPKPPAINCADCGCRAEWAATFGAYMHLDERQEDTHAVVLLSDLDYRPARPEPLRQPLWVSRAHSQA